MSFASAPWTAGADGRGMRHSELAAINLNDPPDLHHAEAVGFDFAVGWSTAHANIDEGTDWFETVAQLVIIAAVAWVSAGTLGPAVATSMGMSTAAAGAATTAATLTTGGMIVSAAVVGAATSLASGLLNDNMTLKGVLRGAFAGALTAGLMQGVSSAFGVTAANPFSTIGGIAARTTVQGAVQALMGGKFADGALAGLASGLAEAASTNMLNAINTSGMTGAEAVAARTFARVIGSAIRASASPGDPGQAFASAFLDDVFKQIDTSTPVTQTAFDDEGRLNLGIVDPAASPEQQAQQLAAQLQRQGIPAAQANLMAQQALGNVVDGVAQLPQGPGSVVVVAPPVVLPPSDPFATISSEDEVSYAEWVADKLGVPRDELVNVGLRDYAGRSAQVLAGFIEGSGFSILDTGFALVEIAKSPGQFINGVKTLLNSAEARAQLGDEIVARVKVDVAMLEDAFNSGDMRGIGQQLGKLTVDFAQIATGVEGLARLGVSTASAGGRLLIGGVDELASLALKKVPGLFDASGAPLMDFRSLSNAQKGVIGELMGADGVRRLVPDAQRIGRTPSVGQQGIDDLYKVTRPDVDYVFVEYKFGSSKLGTTADGLQMSDGWLQGTTSGKNRIAESLGKVEAGAVQDAVRQGRIEKWLVHTDPFGSVTVGLVDRNGKFIPQPISKVIKP